MPPALIPETAPFDAEQRAWLNGFFAGLLGMVDGREHQNGSALSGAPPALADAISAISAISAPPAEAGAEGATAEGEQFPWHDPALPLAERLALAEGKPFERRLMAAMAQLDCGACGYLCKTYAEGIARGDESSLALCSPGGKETAATLRKLLKGRRNGGVVVTGENGGARTREDREANAAGGEESGGVRDHRKNPFAATLVSSTNLNRSGSAKETRHVVLDLSGSGLTYEVGDALGVYPTNCPELVEQVIEASAARGDERVVERDGRGRSLREVLADRDLRDAGEDLLGLLIEVAPASSRDRLRELAAEDDALAELDVLDLLQIASPERADVERFAEALAPLAPRLYSIASSPRAHPEEVHLTIAKATVIAGGRLRKGVASTMFAERLAPGDRVRVFVQPSHGFRLPADPLVPIVMVGPGTGVAPFRAFLEERRASGATGDAWLFCGDRNRATDFLYEDELAAYLADGTLARLDTAFSRDQETKVYVQDRMREHGAELFPWLERGAYFYVCGDARRMAGDVDQALCEVVARHGDRSPEEARAYVSELAKGKRYLRDVY